MKKVYLFLPILAFSFLLISCGDSSPSSPTTSIPRDSVVIRETLRVYGTIQEAIDAASDGQHLDVYPGTYTENPIIEDKQLYIIGTDKSNTIIQGGIELVNFSHSSDACEIRNFTIRGSNSIGDRGVNYFSVSLVISGCIIENNRYNIYCGPGSCGTISENIIRNALEVNVFCANSAPAISSNTITGTSIGIHCKYSATPDIGGGGSGSPGNNVLRYSGDWGSWDLYNSTRNIIKAENNYWDHDTAVSIDGYDIYDDTQSPSLGAVDFQPFLTGEPSASLGIKPRLLSASSLFKDFFRSLFRADLPASAVYISPSLEGRIRLTRYKLLETRCRPLNDKRYYPPLMMRNRR
jgi:hypothetical protein